MDCSCSYQYQDETDPVETTFELNETLYAKANIPPTDEVHIWLGVWHQRTCGTGSDCSPLIAGQRDALLPDR
jgi:hypothetical protein